MKKVLFCLIFLGLGILSPEVEALTTTNEATKISVNSTDAQARKRRNKPKRQRRGFMWGLFKKKSPCGCPNH